MVSTILSINLDYPLATLSVSLRETTSITTSLIVDSIQHPTTTTTTLYCIALYNERNIRRKRTTSSRGIWHHNHLPAKMNKGDGEDLLSVLYKIWLLTDYVDAVAEAEEDSESHDWSDGEI